MFPNMSGLPMQTKNIVFTDYNKINEILKTAGAKRPFLCCSKSFKQTDAFRTLKNNPNITVWDTIRPNPRYEDMISATKQFLKNDCDFIIGAGGGSPIDSAKMIKLMATNKNIDARFETLKDNDIPFLCIPTTSGTGSEATRYSIFYSGETEKHSVSHPGFLPKFVILDPIFLKTVPPYQRVCTCMDALCHAIESYWNVKSTDTSKKLAKKAISLFFNNKEEYINNQPDGNKGMLFASYYAGKAIDITSTTSAHAMCYNLTMNCGTSHGHSVSVCLAEIWEHMLKHNDNINDPRGRDYVIKTLNEIGILMGGKNAKDGLDIFRTLVSEFDLKNPIETEETAEIFSKNVNISRLKNNPTVLDENTVRQLYEKILKTDTY